MIYDVRGGGENEPSDVVMRQNYIFVLVFQTYNQNSRRAPLFGKCGFFIAFEVAFQKVSMVCSLVSIYGSISYYIDIFIITAPFWSIF